MDLLLNIQKWNIHSFEGKFSFVEISATSSPNEIIDETSVDSSNQCVDKGICYNLIFDVDVCALEEVRRTCCESCRWYCHDQASCAKYPMIHDLCDISEEIRQKCPISCGICQSLNGKF